MKTKINEKGYILPVVVMFVVISLILGSGILYLGQTEREASVRRLQREQAFYLAEAGAYRAYAHLDNNINWEPEEAPVALGDGEFFVAKDEDGDIISTGTFNNISETVKLTLEEGDEGNGGPSIFSNGFFGSSKLALTGSSQIHGYDSRDNSVADALVGSNDEIDLGWSTKIYGDVGIGEEGSINRPGNITGEISDGQEEFDPGSVVIPQDLIDMGYTPQGDPNIIVPAAAVNSGQHAVDSSGNFNVGSWPVTAATITEGDYKFKSFNITAGRTVTISGKVRMYIEEDFFKTSGQGHIVLEENATLAVFLGAPDGKMNLAGSSSINNGGSPADVGIYCASDNPLSLTGNTRVNAALFAPESHVQLTGSSEFRGALVSDSINLAGNVRLFFDVALSEMPIAGDQGGGGGGTPGQLQIKRWSKPGWADRFQ